MQRQAIDPIVYPIPSFFRATRIIRNHTAAGGEFTAHELEKLTSLHDRRMLFEAAWLASEKSPGLWYFEHRAARVWWRDWTLVVNPRPELH